MGGHWVTRKQLVEDHGLDAGLVLGLNVKIKRGCASSAEGEFGPGFPEAAS